MYSTIVNCSMLNIVNRIQNIQLQSDIMTLFWHIKVSTAWEKQNAVASSVDNVTPISTTEIISLIEEAKADLTKDMLECNDFKWPVNPTDFETEFQYDEDGHESDDDYWNDEFYDGNINENFTDDFDAEERNDLQNHYNKLSGVTDGTLSLPNYSYTGASVDPKSRFAVVLNSKGGVGGCAETKLNRAAIAYREWWIGKKDYQSYIGNLQ